MTVLRERRKKGHSADGCAGALLEEPAAIRRMAVFHLNGVGDLLFSLPALLALRRAFAHTHITSVIRPYLRDLLEPAGLADEILLRPERRAWGEFLGFVRRLRKGNFDLAVLFSQSASANIYAFLSGTRLRVGFIDTIFPWLLSHVLPRRGITCTAKLLHLAERLGAPEQRRDYVGLLRVSEAQQQKAEFLLRQAGANCEPRVVLSFAEGRGRPYPYKTWSEEKFAAVGRYFPRQGLRPVVIGARADAEAGQRLAENIGEGAISLAGRTSLGELAGVIQRAALLVGIDSGPTHIAAALGIPVVALYGPTDPLLTGPQGEGNIVIRREMACSPCRRPTCENRPCLSGIEPEEVVAAAERLLRRGRTAYLEQPSG